MPGSTFSAGAGIGPFCWREEDLPLEGFSLGPDRLAARALLLRAERPLLLLSLEMTSLPARAVARCKERAARLAALAPEEVLVSVTHTFSCPHIPPEAHTEEDDRRARCLFALLDRAVDAAVQGAVASCGPATVHRGEAPCGLNVNRNLQTPRGWWLGRNEQEYSDHTLRCVALCREGRPIAALLNYDCQPSVLDQVRARDGARPISGDLAGAAMQALEAQYPGLVAIYLPGAAGDQAPLLRGLDPEAGGPGLPFEEAHPIARALGGYLAACAGRLIRQGEAAEAGPLCLCRRTVALPEQEMRYRTPELTPHLRYDFSPTGRTLPAPLILFRLAGAPVLLTAPELNSSFGRRLREVLGPRALIGTLVDGGMKYLPEESDYRRITYTAMNTFLGQGSDRLFLDAVRQAADDWEAGR